MYTSRYLFFGVILTCCLFVSCQSPDSTTQEPMIMQADHSSIPELLPRHTQLGTETEQLEVRNLYEELSYKINQHPEDATSQLKLAQLFMLEARVTGEHGHYYPATLQVLNHLLDQNPEKDVEFGASALKASVLLSLHQFEEAKTVAQHAVSLNGFNALIYGSLVDAHVELGEYADAVKMSDKMNAIRPDLRSYSRVSYLREIYGDLDGAIEAMTRAAETGYPGYEETAWCRLTLGSLYEQQGDLETAKAQYERILQERPQYPFAIAALAGIAGKEQNQELQEALLQQAITIIPEVGFYIDLASLYQDQGREDEKDALVDEILLMLEDDEAAGHVMNLEYAHLYLDLMNDPEKALEYAQKEADIRPKNIDVALTMAEIMVATEDFEAAEEYLKAASSTGNQHPHLLLISGLTSIGLGEKEKGTELIRQSLEKDPYQSGELVAQAQSFLE